MYAWKCWRDNHGVYLLFTGMLFFAMAAFAFLTRNWHAHAIREPFGVLRGLRGLCAMPFVAAFFTNGAPSTELMLTRPLRRWRIIWTAFGISMVKIASLGFLIGAIGWELSAHSIQIYAGPSIPAMIALTIAEVVLAAGILRGLFVIITLTASRRRPVLLGIALTLVPFYWYLLAIYPPMQHWTPWLPMPIPNVVVGYGMYFYYAPGLGQTLLVRALFLLLLTLIAQRMLERREV